MSATEIRAAVDTARTRLPNLAADFADKAIAAGKSVDAVKGELFVMMTVDPRERSKADMLARVAGMKGGSAQVTTVGVATSRNSMLDAVKRAGLTPKA